MILAIISAAGSATPDYTAAKHQLYTVRSAHWPEPSSTNVGPFPSGRFISRTMDGYMAAVAGWLNYTRFDSLSESRLPWGNGAMEYMLMACLYTRPDNRQWASEAVGQRNPRCILSRRR